VAEAFFDRGDGCGELRLVEQVGVERRGFDVGQCFDQLVEALLSAAYQRDPVTLAAEAAGDGQAQRGARAEDGDGLQRFSS
jgi:hypothetical protein